ncbi:hypothetical protein [Paenibacillus sp. FSL H7-0714]|uniref:hypothetical protein n=1 Tax=Paenibacillus sp. FSL H7-0714 TaxID=2954735 RepID=UPI0030FA2DAA
MVIDSVWYSVLMLVGSLSVYLLAGICVTVYGLWVERRAKHYTSTDYAVMERRKR